MKPMDLDRNFVLAAGIALATLFASAQIFASTPPLAAGAQARATARICGTRPGTVLYSARFGHDRRFKVVIGRAQGNPALVAQIWSGGACQASCTEALPGYEKTFLQMNCRGGQIQALNTTLALFREKAKLRFGTWLNGYQDTPLLVEMDRLAPPLVPRLARKPAPRVALVR